MKYLCGFTQIELITTLSIISVISGLAFPSFKDFLAREKSSMSMNTFYAHLNFARSTAITSNTTVTICASNHRSTCEPFKDWANKKIIIFTDTNSNGQRDASEPLLRNIYLGLKKYSLKWNSFGNKTYLQWQPTGMTYYQNGNFNYCPEKKNMRNAKIIILNTAGRIYFGSDKNHDGIQEGTDGKNIQC